MNVKYYVQPVFLAPFYTLADRNIAERKRLTGLCFNTFKAYRQPNMICTHIRNFPDIFLADELFVVLNRVTALREPAAQVDPVHITGK